MALCYNCFSEYADNVPVCPYCGYSAASDANRYRGVLPCGSVLGGRYIVGRVLGKGGFGVTYIALDHSTKKLVAIKEYFPEAFAGRGEHGTVQPCPGEEGSYFEYGKNKFMDEAKALGRFINNPNIVSVYTYFEENNTAYYAMEYLTGCTLKEYISTHSGRLLWNEAERILLPVMNALYDMHSVGMIHRDIKPDNIMMTVSGVPKLLDFGSARYSLGQKSRNLSILVTRGFAPYEQYSSHSKQGPFTDVYGVAATFYYTVTGKVPPDALERKDHDTLVMPSVYGVAVSIEKENALCHALAINAADRYQTLSEFWSDLFLGQPQNIVVPPVVIPVDPPVQPPVPAPAPRKERNTLLLTVGVLSAVALAFLIFVIILLCLR
ncbi:MAG: serine/threonine protein kinase [Ruminiclostridium sp.]|nr:serine/threonine protein kinase [Ruminiclostridium sp.]